MSPPTNGDLSPTDAARVLGVSPRTLLRWLREERIPYVVTEGGEVRLRRDDVMRLIDPPGGPAENQGE